MSTDVWGTSEVFMKIKGMSLFSGGGIGEFRMNETNVDVVIANELLSKRCEFYKFYHPKCDVVNADITKRETKDLLIEKAKKAGVDFIMATPPCQGASLIGKNKDLESMKNDFRNYLVFDAVEIIEAIKPTFVMIENVTRFYEMLYLYKNEPNVPLLDILKDKFGEEYNIEYNVFNCEEYDIPQARKRGIVRMWKKGNTWSLPKKGKTITVREAIGDLPSLEAGQSSNIKNHYARNHTPEHILCMKHTPTGHSAFENPVYYPKDKNGKKVRGFSATFKRIDWDAPAPTITMRNDCISSQSNVHPGRLLPDGTYSDARVLTPRELLILSSIDPDIDLPKSVSESQIRYMIGEGIPPLLVSKIVKGVAYGEN